MAARKKYELTPEHRGQLSGWADRWIENAMSTRPMDDADRDAMRVAVAGLYEAAGLPQPKHVVFVPSPLVLAFAGAFAAGIWHVSRHGLPTTRDATIAATRDATIVATRAATIVATRAATIVATDVATDAATRVATIVATRAATNAATRDATIAATNAATSAATDVATSAATRDATRAATRDATIAATSVATSAATNAATSATPDLYARFLLSCCQWYYRMWDGGNQWSAWSSYLSFFRHIARLDLPEYDRWQHYENAAIHGGPRIMHPDFCMVSDRPEILLVDDERRPHCDTGPSHRWRDGWELYYVHGVRVTRQIVMEPETLAADAILAEQNAEVRRVMIDRFTPERLMREANAERVQQDDFGVLWRLPVEDDEPLVMVELENSTVEPDGSRKTYFLRVPPGMMSARDAVAWTFDMSSDEYVVVAAS